MVVSTLQQARQQIEPFKPKKVWYRRWVKRSAVALILRQADNGLEALMIKRAEREGDPWSGHMAFPGGRGEVSDVNNLHTARRETWEEIGLNTDQHTRVLGRLSDIATPRFRGHHRMVVTPYLFTIDQVPELSPNHEVAEVIWIPLNFLANHNNREQMQWQIKGVDRDIPCYFYNEKRIWGLSLLMLDELVGLIHPQS